jgi:methionyl-tRNA formyltransferase
MTKVAFATCVQLGLSCIEAIYDLGGSLALLITLPDDRAAGKSGRVYLDSLAAAHQVPLLKVPDINSPEVLEALHRYAIDWLLIIGWSQLAKPGLLAAPGYGCIGMHPTLLPEGRGRASIPWAILKGLRQTGVTLFKMDAGTDTGDIIGQGVIPLDDRTTATWLYKEVCRMHAALIRQYWPDIVGGSLTLTKQSEAAATVWPGRRPEDGELFPDMTMAEADRLVRAVTRPYPGAFYRTGNSTLRVWASITSDAPKDIAIRLRDGFLIPLEYEVEGLVTHINI